jgi:hypothetical protein
MRHSRSFAGLRAKWWSPSGVRRYFFGSRSRNRFNAEAMVPGSNFAYLVMERGSRAQGSSRPADGGRSKANLERALARPEKVRRDAYVDTAAPGTSASDRRAGYGATAARNTRSRTSGMASALEDSRTRPSRKSTRKSANRTRAATALELRATLRTRSPKSRAGRARARRPR